MPRLISIGRGACVGWGTSGWKSESPHVVSYGAPTEGGASWAGWEPAWAEVRPHGVRISPPTRRRRGNEAHFNRAGNARGPGMPEWKSESPDVVSYG